MENTNLFQRIAYHGAPYDTISHIERGELADHKKYLDKRLQDYDPKIVKNWIIICQELKKDGYILDKDKE